MDKSLLSIGQTAKSLGISIDTLRRWDKKGQFNSIRVGTKGNRYFRRSDIDLFLNDLVTQAKNWSQNEIPNEPNAEVYCKTRDVFQARLEHFQSDLTKSTERNLTSLITAIVGEIGNNSFDHNLGNWPDILGVYFSYSLAQKKVVLADRGQGILATLKRVVPELTNHQDALEVAFTETISARSPESRGNGLKFVKNVVIHNPINLIFQTGNAILILNNKSTEIKASLADETMRGCIAIVEY